MGKFSDPAVINHKPFFGLLCPGQGAQSPGMGCELLSHFPETRRIFEEASESIHFDLAHLVTSNDLAIVPTLESTEFAQPSILTTSYAWFSVLKEHCGLFTSAIWIGVGHSLGEYTALLIAESISLFDVVPLVRQRGQYMQQAVPHGEGGMLAILALDREILETICQDINNNHNRERTVDADTWMVGPANYNAPLQIVVSGTKDGLIALKTTLEKGVWKHHTFKPPKIIPLKVSAPFHSPLMEPAQKKLSSHLKNINWKTPTFPILHNVDNASHPASQIASILEAQITAPIDWVAAQKKALEYTNEYIELGPGKVLNGLLKRIDNQALCSTIDGYESFKKFEEQINLRRKTSL